MAYVFPDDVPALFPRVARDGLQMPASERRSSVTQKR